MEKRKRRSYTVMFIPDDNGKPFSFRIGGAVVRAFVFFDIIFILGIAALLFKAGDIGVRLQLVHALREENSRLKQQNAKLMQVTQKLHGMERMSAYLRRLATAVGEGDAGAAAAAARDDEKIFSEDSLDNFLDQVRAGEADELKELSQDDATPELLLGAIPNIRPVEGWITKTFSAESKGGAGHHPGVDFAAARGTLIRATAPGTVDAVFHDKYFGLVVIVKHSFGFETRYGHCQQVLVAAADAVERGQAIALVGNTGRSSGPHLHYEVLRNGKQVDPIRYIIGQSSNP